MKRVFLLFTLCYFCSSASLAEGITKDEIKLDNTSITLPLALSEKPTAYQKDAIISIQIPDVSSCVSVIVVNTETGEQVHSMVYSGSNEIVINLSGKEEGFYTLYIEVDGTEYSGTFIL